jgi:hypothetical protein
VIWFVAGALAQESGPIERLVWARPFVLAQAAIDPNGPAPKLGQRAAATLTAGWIVEIRADPALLRPSDAHEPHLYVGTQRAHKLNWDYEGGCLVAIVSGRPDLAAAPIFFGAAPQPGEVEAAIGEAEAARMQIRPRDRGEVERAVAAGGAELRARDLREIRTVAMQRVFACTSTPSDLQRTPQ